VRILHISDLHVVDPTKDRHRQRRGLVLGKAWDENLDEITRDGPIDLVCFIQTTRVRRHGHLRGHSNPRHLSPQ
jgi:hypothetical protein